MKKTKPWHRSRHVFWFHFQRFFLRPYFWVHYHFHPKKFDNKKRPYLFLYNHQTPYDQNLLYNTVTRLPYTIATEDLFTMGRLSRFIAYANAPIPFQKSMSDVKALMRCIRIVREGQSIALSPEGNRTFTGETVNIKPSIASLIKALRLPVAFFSVNGGYEVIPRYADKPRKGPRVKAYVSRVVEYEEYKDMSDEELYALVLKEMHHDESVYSVPLKSNRRAEFMERAVYVCPSCKKIGTLKSKGNKITCTSCGATGEVDPFGQFNQEFPVRNVKDWTRFQNEWITSYDFEADGDKPIFEEEVRFRRLNQKEFCKDLLSEKTTARLYADRLEVGENVYPYSEVDAMTVCGRSRLDFYTGGVTYQLDGANEFCALKYVNIFYRYRNAKEDGDGFLGI